MKLSQGISNEYPKDRGVKGLKFIIELSLEDTKMVYEKSLYTVFDLLGDVGGLLDLFVIFFTIIF